MPPLVAAGLRQDSGKASAVCFRKPRIRMMLPFFSTLRSRLDDFLRLARLEVKVRSQENIALRGRDSHISGGCCSAGKRKNGAGAAPSPFHGAKTFSISSLRCCSFNFLLTRAACNQV
jgi:hypothetical protein